MGGAAVVGEVINNQVSEKEPRQVHKAQAHNLLMSGNSIEHHNTQKISRLGWISETDFLASRRLVPFCFCLALLE